MKIALYVGTQEDVSWNRNTIINAGLGTFWGSAYGLAGALVRRHHEVAIWGYVNKPNIYDGIEFRDIRTDTASLKYDVIIGVESFPTSNRITATKRVLWFKHTKSSDVLGSPYDILVLRSEVQKKFLESERSLPARTRVIPDGINNLFFERGSVGRPIDVLFVGHPVKGMNDLMEYTRQLRAKNNKAFVHVYGNAEIWGWDNMQFNTLYHNMIKEGILYHGRHGLEKIARRVFESKIFIYPCNIEIAMGVAVLEAMAGGAVPITTSMGNLPGIITPDRGYIIDGDTKSFAWISKAVDATMELLTNDIHREKLSRAAQKYVQENHRWSDIAVKWENNVLL